MPRAFFAIALTPAITGALGDCRRACLDADPAWAGEKWVSPENLHVTLRFLGDIPESVLHRYAEAADTTLRCHAPYTLSIDRVRAVPRLQSASMIWAVPEAGADRTIRLARLIEDVVVREGAAPETRRFSPHVTLCRARRPRHLAPDAARSMDAALEHVPVPHRSMSVREVMLYTSTLTPDGPVYDRFAVMSLVD